MWKSVGWTEEHCQHVNSLMSIDFSTATTKERERFENNLALSVNGQGPKPDR